MKNKRVLNTMLTLCLLIASSFGLAACDGDYKINLTTENNISEVKRGDTVQFKTAIESKTQIDGNIEYVIEDGKEFATITTAGLLTVKSDAEIGEKIEVIGKLKKIESEKYELTIVDTELTGITVSPSASTNIERGATSQLSAVLAPTNTTQTNITYSIVQNADYATISASGLLTVKEEAPYGILIRVKASFGQVNSNILEFKVVQASALSLVLDDETINVDSRASSPAVTTVNVMSGSNPAGAGNPITYSVKAGSEDFVSILQNGNACTFTAKKHGQAKVLVTLNGTAVTEEITLNCIVPPTNIVLPDVFDGRTLNYAYSCVDDLPFVASIGSETGVCSALNYAFDREGVTYEEGKIKFTEPFIGNLKVTVSSNSGSVEETTEQYTFAINQGVNVETYEELQSVVTAPTYNGEIVNIVVLQKPTNTANSYKYGYDLVPAPLLASIKPTEPQNFRMLIYGNTNINGNGHTINLSQLGLYNTDDGVTGHFGDYINIKNTEENPENFAVNINNLRILNNPAHGYDYVPTANDVVGVYKRAIHISASKSSKEAEDSKKVARVVLENLTIDGFSVGIRMERAAAIMKDGVPQNSFMKNVTVNNCFTNGIELASCIITLQDMTYGLCGAAGIEFTPDGCEAAQALQNNGTYVAAPQKITFAGDLKILDSNYSAGDSNYFTALVTAGEIQATIPNILTGTMAGIFEAQGKTGDTAYMQAVSSNVMKDVNGQDVFTLVGLRFLFSEAEKAEAGHQTFGQNATILDYAGFDSSNFVVNFQSLTGVNTLSKYIILDIPRFGSVILYNYNYIPQE